MTKEKKEYKFSPQLCGKSVSNRNLKVLEKFYLPAAKQGYFGHCQNWAPFGITAQQSSELRQKLISTILHHRPHQEMSF